MHTCTRCCMHGIPLTDICNDCKFNTTNGESYSRQVPETQWPCPHTDAITESMDIITED